MHGIARPFFVGLQRIAGGVMAGLFNRMGHGGAAAYGGFIGNFDVADKHGRAADNAI